LHPQPLQSANVCGISAIVEYGAAGGERTARDLATMHGCIAHRGPNGEAFLFVDEKMGVRRGESLPAVADAAHGARLALAFRWLAVQDCDRAALQPISNADGSVWIAFNGEIYNFVELRRELEASGYTFRTHVDTEVILAAYDRWGSGCLEKFEGMWAIVIADLRRRRLFGSRDRFGMKPLVYAIDGTRILFASEIKQLVAALGRAQVHEPHLYDYLHGHREHLNDDTFYRGIRLVPAASCFELDLDAAAPSLQFQTWWDLSRLSSTPRLRLTEEEAAHELDALLRTAVTRHIRADVKVGSFASGGLDSTLLSAIVRDVAPERRETYSIVFDRGRYARFDESPFIDDFIRHSNLPNFRTTFDAAWLREQMGSLTRIQDEPLIASTLFAQYRAFELAKEHDAVVVLDGQGADEVFGGYGAHEVTVWQERLLRGQLVDFARESRILARNYRAPLARMAYANLARPLAAAAARTLGAGYSRYNWLDERFFRSHRRAAPPEERERRREIARWRSRLDRQCYAEIRYTSLPQLFLFSDRSAMAHSIEARLPFVDHRLVEFAMTLPAAMKTGFGVRKRLLRRVARRYLPDSIVDRPDKMGFMTPEPIWLREELRHDVLAAGDSQALARLPFLRIENVRRFLRGYMDGRHNDFRAVWRIWALKTWVDVNGI
jgi:asparagine synthase (glutamine-hydrolysing)